MKINIKRPFIILQLAASLLLTLQEVHAVEFPDPDPNQVLPARQVQDLNNLILEEHEAQEIVLSNYFAGQLLDYSISSIFNTNTSWIADQEVYKMIRLSDPFNKTSSQYLNNDPNQHRHVEPLPRSTLFFNEDSDLTAYILDRNLNFMKYDATQYADGVIKQLYSFQLNTTVVNDSCTDMMKLNYTGYVAIFLFCRSQKQDFEQSGLYQSSIIAIENYATDTPIFRYYTHTPFSFTHFGFNELIGLQFAGYYSTDLPSDKFNYALFAINGHQGYREEMPLMISFNISMFQEMKTNNIQYLDLVGDEYTPLRLKCYVSLEEQARDERVVDILVLKTMTTDGLNFIAFLVEEKGVVICQMTNIQSTMSLQYECDSHNSQFLDQDHVLSLYKNPQSPNCFYVTTSLPAGILEIDISNIRNAFIYMMYQINEGTFSRYVGLPTMTANNNFIIHSMYDIVKQQDVLRVYSRNATFLNVARYDYLQPLNSRSNFYIFPNYFMNILWMRDERRINITNIMDTRLIIDATNSSLVLKYNQITFTINLQIENSMDPIYVPFNVTFVDQYNTEVISLISNKQKVAQKIFYNCGDNNFQYKVSDLFDGPNFNLTLMNNLTDCTDNACHFEFVNQGYEKTFDYEMDFSDCQFNGIFPDTNSRYDNHQLGERMVLVCLDSSGSQITSYILDTQTKSTTLTNTITIPQLQFLHYGYDETQRILFLIGNSLQEWQQNDTWVLNTTKKEIHFFSIQDQIVWKNYQLGSDQYIFKEDIATFSYNSQIGKGIMISVPNLDYFQIIAYFYLDFETTILRTVKEYYIPVQNGSVTIKAQVSSEGFIFALTSDNKINVYQILKIDKDNYLFTKMQSKEFRNSNTIHDFDIFDGQYFVAYIGDNEVEVYEIQMQIYLQFKMKLPFYKQYASFQFSLPSLLNSKQKNVTRRYKDSFLSLLMVSQSYNGQKSTQIFVFNLVVSQHSSFSMTYDFSDVLNDSNYSSISLMKQLNNSLSLISNTRIQLYNVRYYNYIALNHDSGFFQHLLEICSPLKVVSNKQGVLIDHSFNLSTIYIQSNSMFTDQSHINNRKVQLSIYTQSQGLAITPSQEKEVNITYTNGHGTRHTDVLLLENVMEGYNLAFQTTCTYYDYAGLLRNCTIAGIDDYSTTVIYKFYIEFVAMNRIVNKQFTLSRLFFMFDSSGRFTVLKLPDDNLDLDQINGQSLQIVATLRQLDFFGCLINGYAYAFPFIKASDTIPYSIYLAIYQCREGTTQVLKLAQIRINDRNNKDEQFRITPFKETLRLPYNVLDVSKIQLLSNPTTTTSVDTLIAFTCEIKESFTNLLMIYKLTIDTKSKILQFTKFDELSALNTGFDTFKVTQILTIPESQLIVVVASDTGVYIYDMVTQVILAVYNLKDDHQFNYQDEKQIGELEVFMLAGNWPYSFHVLSNYGIFIYAFNVSLTDRNQVFPNFQKTLKPVEMRLIRIYFDKFNNEIASNTYGYSFLVTKYTSSSTYDVYLGAVSYFSGLNSKVFKMMKIASNTNCLSLSEESYLASSIEDQIAVSFICNTQLFIVRICMRPHVEFTLEQFNDTENPLIKRRSDQLVQQDLQQYSKFNVTIKARNDFTINETNVGVVHLNLLFEEIGETNNKIIYIAALVMFGIAIFIILTLSKSKQSEHIFTDDDLRKYSKSSKSTSQSPNRRTSGIDLQKIVYMQSKAQNNQHLSNRSALENEDILMNLKKDQVQKQVLEIPKPKASDMRRSATVIEKQINSLFKND